MFACMRACVVCVLYIGKHFHTSHVCVSFVVSGHSGIGVDRCVAGARPPPLFSLVEDAIGNARCH